MAGCKVFTRPPSISGAPVNSETYVTGNFASFLIKDAVPPLANNLKPASTKLFAKSSNPVLSDTLMRAEKRIFY